MPLHLAPSRKLDRFGRVVSAKVMAGRCFGFVEFEARDGAEAALLAGRAGAVLLAGRPLRVDWAQGSLPGWKRTGSSGGGGYASGGGEGGEAVRRRPAAALIEARFGVPAAAVAAASAAVAMLPLGGGGGVAQPLLSYDDL